MRRATHSEEIVTLFGRYGEASGLELKQVAEISKSKPEHV
jgi:hypothetical protein